MTTYTVYSIGCNSILRHTGELTKSEAEARCEQLSKGGIFYYFVAPSNYNMTPVGNISQEELNESVGTDY